MNTTNYKDFSTQDFLNDDFFVRWVVNNDSESNSFWNQFMIQYPEKKDEIIQAVDLVKIYRMQNTFSNENNQARVWDRITKEIREEAPARGRVMRMSMFKKLAAAAVIIAIGIGIFYFVDGSANNKVSIATNYGEIKTITLPDNSIVTLNGNSSISYKKNWDGKSAREVWIEGEAFFEVTHINKNPQSIAPGDRFIVHGGDVNVEVLGTSFNIRKRHDKINIGLVSGKIAIHSAENAKPEGYVMHPGDYVEYRNSKMVVKKILSRPEQITTWTKRTFLFSNSTLGEIIEVLEDDYGYTIKGKEDKLLNQKIEGDINVVSVDELLEVISTTLNLNIDKTEKTIHLSTKP